MLNSPNRKRGWMLKFYSWLFITSSAAIIDRSDGILTEILLYLPTKTLNSLKSVAKRYLSLISSSHFSLLHSLCHRPTTDASALYLRKAPSNFYLLSLWTKPSKMQTFKFNLTPVNSYNSAAATVMTMTTTTLTFTFRA